MKEGLENNKLFASCPICAHKLCKGENGTKVEILCERCKNIISVVIENGKVRTSVLPKKK